MPKKLGVLTVHGMGEQKKDYANPMIEELHNRIFGDSVSIEDSEIAWEAATGRMRSSLRRINSGKTCRITRT